MKYFRLVFKKDDVGVAFSEITEDVVDDKTFSEMNWEKPIIRHHDGKFLHLLSIHRDYLEAVILGVAIYNDLTTD